MNILIDVLQQLQKGANEARSDDVRRIKEAVVKWLSTTPLSDADAQTIMSDADKLQRAALLIGIDQAHRTMSRGFNNDVTGLLLCPIDYDWSLARCVVQPFRYMICSHFFSVRKGIKDGDPEFSLANNFYLRALYKNATGDPDDVQKGFLRSQLLVQVRRRTTCLNPETLTCYPYGRHSRQFSHHPPPLLPAVAPTTRTPLQHL